MCDEAGTSVETNGAKRLVFGREFGLAEETILESQGARKWCKLAAFVCGCGWLRTVGDPCLSYACEAKFEG